MRTLKYIALAFFALLAVLSCKRPDRLGPELAFASSSFQLTSPLKAKLKTVNFVTRKNFFLATFSENVSWKLTVRGLTSNAFKNFDGVSDRIDSTMTYWDGSTNGKGSEVNLFHKEKAVAYLEILGLPTVFTDTITISSIKRPSNAYVILADYENNSTKNGIWNSTELFGNLFYNQKQIEFSTPLYPFFFSDLEDKTDNYIQFRDTKLDAPQGTNYLVINALDKSKDYYITNFGFNAGGSNNVPMFDETTTNKENRAYFPITDSLYFNLFIYGNGAANKVKLAISFTEQSNPENGFGDKFDIIIEPNHIGWKYFSFKYTDDKVAIPGYIISSIPAGYTPTKESTKIVSVGFIVQVLTNAGDRFDLIMDYPCFTYGKPLLDVNR